MNPVASQPTGSSDAAAALQGASLAFQKKSPSPTTPIRKKDNGALTAATASSSAASRSASPSKRSGPQAAGGNAAIDVDSHGASPRFGSGGGGGISGSNGHLQAGIDVKSPSFIAATLAASRSASPSPMHRTPRRVASIGGGSTASGNDAVESLSIPPTTSLISMFERGKEGDPVKRASPRRIPTESSEDSLPETWRAPVKLPGIAKTHSIPAKQSTTSGDGIREPRRTPISANKDADATPRPKVATKTFIAEVAELKKPALPEQAVRVTPASPPQKLKPVTRPTPAPAKVSQEDVSALQQRRTGLTAGEAAALPKPKPKPESKPKPRLAAEPQVPQQLPSTPQGQRAPQEERRPVQTGRDSATKPAKPKPPPLNPVPRHVSHSTPEVLSPKPTRPINPVLQVSHASPVKSVTSPAQPQPSSAGKKRPPTPPQPRGTDSRPISAVTSTRFVKSASDLGTAESHKPKAMAMVHARNRSDTMSTEDSFVSASSYQSLGRLSPPLLPARRGSGTASIASAPSPSRGTPRPQNSSTSNLGLSNLTNAIMAGSLASARLTPHNTGSSLPPSLPKRQRSPRLRETMRKPNSVEPDDPDHYKPHKHKLSRGKHKHHEGSRKRWRDQITPRERKRYEALWASNRGALLPPTVSSSSASVTSGGRQRDTTELVANVVVRELWRRSRLPEDELAEVWDLVDREKRGWLGRQEFVVGTWLIDQRLKGRKIPLKVSDSVWSSANGVRVMKPKSK